MVQAFDKFKNHARTDFKLVIVGEKSKIYKEAQLALDEMKHYTDISFTGRLQQDELRNVIGAAFALTFVPYFEGFGLPILEAMACEVPVITSETTSMPEVGGDAAVYVDPFSINSIKNAMLFLSESEDLRNRLIEKGRLQAKKFTWEKTSTLYWESIQKCM